MKRLLFVIIALTAAALRADLLLWQLDDRTALPKEWQEGSYPAVTEAWLVAGTAPGSGTGSVLQKAGVDFNDAPVMDEQRYDLAVLPDAASQSFYIELYSFDNGRAVLQAYTGAVEYEALKEFMLGSLMQSVTPWNGGTFTAAPEPTGGMLVLLGLGVLGLRRRRMA